jgi:hypothetical protein
MAAVVAAEAAGVAPEEVLPAEPVAVDRPAEHKGDQRAG